MSPDYLKANEAITAAYCACNDAIPESDSIVVGKGVDEDESEMEPLRKAHDACVEAASGGDAVRFPALDEAVPSSWNGAHAEGGKWAAYEASLGEEDRATVGKLQARRSACQDTARKKLYGQ